MVVLFASLLAPTAAAQACFESSSADVGSGGSSVTTADLDGDGDADAAVANGPMADGTVTVILNQGDGSFGVPTSYPVGPSVRCVAAGDLDSDGDVDLIATHASFNPFSYVSVLMNQSNGSFAAVVHYPVASPSFSATCADLDGDGDTDIAVANYFASTVSVLANNGDGTFAAHVQLATQSLPHVIVHADLDGDGDQDLAVGHLQSTTVAVLRNHGDGTFDAFVSYDAGWGCHGLTTADLDGDGDLDLATALYDYYRASVLMNHGDASFAPPVLYPAGFDPRSVTSFDADGDGDADLVTADGTLSPNTVSVLVNHGDGTFAAPASFITVFGPFGVVAADVDRDLDDDLLVVGTGSSFVSVLKSCGPSATPFCFGDGSSASCPCGNDGDPSHGCASSIVAAGAYLGGSGSASVSAQSFVLQAQQVTGNVTLFYQGDAQRAPAMLDDGLSCVSGAIVRLGLSANYLQTSIYPEPGDSPVSVKGLIPASGGTRYYQGWYRNVNPSFCPPATTNRTNGLIVLWTP